MFGRGRGIRVPRKVGYDAAVSMSLDEVIATQRDGELSTAEKSGMSLGDIVIQSGVGKGRGRGSIIRCGGDVVDKAGTVIKREIEVRGTLGAISTQGGGRSYTEDADKPLEQIVMERGYGAWKKEQAPRRPNIKREFENGESLESSGVGDGGQVDARMCSLDEVIAVRGIKDESRRNENRGMAGRGNGKKRGLEEEEPERVVVPSMINSAHKRFRSHQPYEDHIRGPFMVVQHLKRAGMLIDIKYAVRSMENEDNDRKWRAIVTCGTIEVMAESNRKQVSREMACYQFLRKLKEWYPDGKIPHYEIEAELFFDPKVMTEITTLAQEKEVGLSVSSRFEDGKGHICTFILDGEEISESHLEQQYAQLKAAYMVYEILTGEQFPTTPFFLDEGCDMIAKYEMEEPEDIDTLAA